MDTAGLEQAVQVLQKHKQEWAVLPVERKIEMLLQVRKRLGENSDAWVEAIKKLQRHIIKVHYLGVLKGVIMK